MYTSAVQVLLFRPRIVGFAAAVSSGSVLWRFANSNAFCLYLLMRIAALCKDSSLKCCIVLCQDRGSESRRRYRAFPYWAPSVRGLPSVYCMCPGSSLCVLCMLSDPLIDSMISVLFLVIGSLSGPSSACMHEYLRVLLCSDACVRFKHLTSHSIIKSDF